MSSLAPAGRQRAAASAALLLPLDPLRDLDAADGALVGRLANNRNTNNATTTTTTNNNNNNNDKHNNHNNNNNNNSQLGVGSRLPGCLACF